MLNQILWLGVDEEEKSLVHDLLGKTHTITFLSKPADALLQINYKTYDLFVIDLHLPNENGLDIIKQVYTKWPEMATIALYPRSHLDIALNAIRAGATEVLENPFSSEMLVFTVEKVLEKHRMSLGVRRHYQRIKEQAERALRDLEKANENLRRTRYYLENLLNSSVDSVLILTTDLYITYTNRGTTHILGYSPDSLIGVSLKDLLRGGEQESEQLLRELKTGPIQNHETEMLHENGNFVAINASLSMVRGQAGKVFAILAICKDITKQKQLEQALNEKSIRDDLTGLYNQRYFYERLTAEIERAKRQNHPLSLLLFDVDHFKKYNDTYGHIEGDRLLKTIGEVVRESTRGFVDIPCRYGGDEFTVILPETGLEIARAIAERIRASFEARHFDNCTLSVGLMTYLKDTTAESFIRFADEMMYLAKRSGGNCVFVYDPEKRQAREEPGPDRPTGSHKKNR